MKLGMRKPSLKKSISARTTGRVKRSAKRMVNPFYGKKGVGLIKNPQKSIYNRIYKRLTFGLPLIFKLFGKKSEIDNKNISKSNTSEANSMKTKRIITKFLKIILYTLLLFIAIGIIGSFLRKNRVEDPQTQIAESSTTEASTLSTENTSDESEKKTLNPKTMSDVVLPAVNDFVKNIGKTTYNEEYTAFIFEITDEATKSFVIDTFETPNAESIETIRNSFKNISKSISNTLKDYEGNYWLYVQNPSNLELIIFSILDGEIQYDAYDEMYQSFGTEQSTSPTTIATDPITATTPEQTTTTTTTTTTIAEPDIAVTSLTTPVVRNQMATIAIQGKPNTEYKISVFYSTSASTAEGLEKKISDDNGNVSWTWKIGGKTNAGTYKIKITGGDQTIETYITITE